VTTGGSQTPLLIVANYRNADFIREISGWFINAIDVPDEGPGSSTERPDADGPQQRCLTWRWRKNAWNANSCVAERHRRRRRWRIAAVERVMLKKNLDVSQLPAQCTSTTVRKGRFWIQKRLTLRTLMKQLIRRIISQAAEEKWFEVIVLRTVIFATLVCSAWGARNNRNVANTADVLAA
jgi:hypothetical protein